MQVFSLPGDVKLRLRLKALERENRELRQANEVLRKASACFAMIEGNAALLRALPEMLDRRSGP